MRQQLLDAAGRKRRQTFEHVFQVDIRIMTVELGGLDALFSAYGSAAPRRRSNLRHDELLDFPDFQVITAIKGPLLRALRPHKARVHQNAHVLAQGRLGNPELIRDRTAADTVLDEIAVHLRREMSFGIFQPLQDLSTPITSERPINIQHFHVVNSPRCPGSRAIRRANRFDAPDIFVSSTGGICRATPLSHRLLCSPVVHTHWIGIGDRPFRRSGMSPVYSIA